MKRGTLLLSLTPFMLAAAPDPQARHWAIDEALRPGQSVTISLVRAHVRRVNKSGRIRLEMTIRGRDRQAVMIAVARTPTGLILEDRYPASSLAAFAECVPPLTARGAFWRSEAYFDVTISAPRSTPVDQHVMEVILPSDRRQSN